MIPTVVIDFEYYNSLCCVFDSETAYSTWNDLQKSLKVVGNVILC